MQNIIYACPGKIDWDAQSAFKVTNYCTDTEEHMIFCYLKMFVQNGDLKLCSFCFDKEAQGKQDLQLCLNLNPEQTEKFVSLEFGFDGINSFDMVNAEKSKLLPIEQDKVSFRSFRTNDQQGFYWCGEITIPKEFIAEYFETTLKEKSIITLNFYKIFPECSDYACLFPDSENDIFLKGDFMQEFVILDY